MRLVVTTRGSDPGGTHELRRWLAGEPRLRGRIRKGGDAAPPPGTMGAGTDALIALLEPGGVAAVFAGAVVAWVQSRRGSQTVTVTRPDGTEITITTTQVKGLDARQTAELAQQLAAAVDPPSAAPDGDPGPGGHPEPDGDPEPDERRRPDGRAEPGDAGPPAS
ncbi:hypothetical protein ACIBAI_13830 [Streptomyces sp. NPDC051041]|uniref:effector-associated constant component EACC1 n=1 Tax=Streptomyces sp. NPDC051041 TaxID=3365640 RepID=UPI0037B13A5E